MTAAITMTGTISITGAVTAVIPRARVSVGNPIPSRKVSVVE